MGRLRSSRLLFILVVMSFLLSTVVSLVSLHVMNRRNVREMNKVLATQVYDHIIGELSEPIMVARTMSNDSFLADALTDERSKGSNETSNVLKKYLTNLEDGLGYNSTFVISCDSERYYTSAGLVRTVDPKSEQDSWYPKFLASPDEYDLDVDNDEVDSSSLSVYVNAKIEGKDNNPLGLCGVGVRMVGIQDLFRILEEDFNVKINLVDPDGVVQVDTDASNIEKTNLSHLIVDDKSSQYVYRDTSAGFAVTKYMDSLDWYLVIQSKGANEVGEFANVVLLNMALCALVLIIMVIALRYNRKSTEELAKASLIDAATQLHNRRAFEEDKARFGSTPPRSDFVCVTADVNGLKTANDTLGHDAGDELIRGAADCLSACMSKYGTVYRIGGDEFAALLYVSPEDFDPLRNQIDHTIEQWSGIKVKSVAVSCGFASAREFPGESVPELCRISDKRMYEEKARYYERMGISRRRT